MILEMLLGPGFGMLLGCRGMLLGLSFKFGVGLVVGCFGGLVLGCFGVLGFFEAWLWDAFGSWAVLGMLLGPGLGDAQGLSGGHVGEQGEPFGHGTWRPSGQGWGWSGD